MNLNMKLDKQLVIALVITILGFLFRIYQVQNIPPSLSWDEVSIGYNAYSILKIARDEHQRFLPLDAFAAFGDYKPPVAIYLTVPSIAIFGLNEFSVRFPSVLAGTITILLTYFLVKELFDKNKNKYLYAILSSALLAISPWHLQLSRAGFEANIAVMFVVLGIWLILLARKQSKYLYFCWIPFVIAVYTFNSSRYFVPLIGFALLIYTYKGWAGQIKKLIIGLVIAAVLMLPILPHLVSPQSRLRFQEVSIFTDQEIIRIANKRINDNNRVWWSKVIYNRRWGYFRSYLSHYLDHFQSSFLFIQGDGNPKFSIQDVGELYLLEFPFLIYGIYLLAKADKRTFWLLLVWLLTAIAPAAVARETPHALRTENTLPVWQIFTSLGIIGIYEQIPKNRLKKLYFAAVTLVYIFSFLYFQHNYYSHYPAEYSGEWQYGYKQAIDFIAPIKDKYQHIYLTESIGRPYIYVAFYEKIDPRVYGKEIKGGFDAAGFYNVTGLGKYIFIRDKYDQTDHNGLYIVPASEVPHGEHLLKTINLLNGQPVLKIYDYL